MTSLDQNRLRQFAQAAGCDVDQIAIVVVDHGSRREESNRGLEQIAAMMADHGPFAIVEPAHMELAEPSIPTAVARCAARGARLVILSPFFLSPGQHWTLDIPRLADEAVAPHAGLRHLVAAPLGTHPGLVEILLERIAELAD
jgi:sirohydrochlorin ferrochelatase